MTSQDEGTNLDELLRQCAEEREQLRAEIQRVRERLDALTTDTRENLAELDAGHREAMEAIRDGALAEASRLIEEAGRRAEEIRAHGERLIQLSDGTETP